MSTIHVSDQAARWYKEELNLNEGDSIRFLLVTALAVVFIRDFLWESPLKNRDILRIKRKFPAFNFLWKITITGI